MSLTDKVITVTGGASGIGLATSKILASRGAKLSIADVNKDNLAAAQKHFDDAGLPCLTTVVDVTKSKEVDDWIAATVKHYGSLDGSANCAGIGNSRAPKIRDSTDEEWRKVLDVNLDGVFFCVRAQARAMSENGSIVNIASVAGLRGFANQGSYCASKSGVIGISKTIAHEESHRGVRCNAICPGLIDTPLTAPKEGRSQAGTELLEKWIQGVPLKRKGEAEEVGQLITWLISSESSYITGTAMTIDGGMMG